ncbi:MAG: S8 family serine peptidase [Methylophagaceae bacterium]|jgi:subtilisin family serine protease|tara:strand:+ start:825 stop:2396 length:1572 start_codon:yes stop_codon:yes gene_type:complete
MEKEYIVVVHRGIDLKTFDAELSATSGAGPIPNRSVDIANPRPGSTRMTHWMLTDEEATTLSNDPRVLSVEIPPEQRDDIELVKNASQTGTFYRSISGSALTTPSYVNWGLRRCIETTNVYGSNNTVAGNYDYALDGTGVDVVIQDSGIDPNHPEFNVASSGSRIKQIDWYTESGLSGIQSADHYRDADGHGTHCAGIAAGKTYGWAKGADVYSQKLAGLETLSGSDGTGIPIASAFDAIRLWHNAKSNGRPTVVNMSWGYGSKQTVDPTSGTYRGTPWNYGSDYTTRADLWAATGVSTTFFGSMTLPVRVPSVDAEIEDMIDAGIHVCIAAGNNRYKADLPTGTDYNNSVVFGGSTYQYHRGSSPFSNDAFMVGNIDAEVNLGVDKIAGSSTRGPAINIYAPGDNIMSTSSVLADALYTLLDYPGDSTYKIMSIGGTSMASPQVAGVCALHLQVQPDLTPEQLKDKVISDSKSVISTTGSETDYEDYENSLLGGPNRMLYSRYGSNTPWAITGTINISGGLQ